MIRISFAEMSAISIAFRSMGGLLRFCRSIETSFRFYMLLFTMLGLRNLSLERLRLPR